MRVTFIGGPMDGSHSDIPEDGDVIIFECPDGLHRYIRRADDDLIFDHAGPL